MMISGELFTSAGAGGASESVFFEQENRMNNSTNGIDNCDIIVSKLWQIIFFIKHGITQRIKKSNR